MGSRNIGSRAWGDVGRRNEEIRVRFRSTLYAIGVQFGSWNLFACPHSKGLLPACSLKRRFLLTIQPNLGDVIPGGRGLRKLRRPAKGHGKRGGARVIYYHVNAQHLIVLIFAYAKNEVEDLDAKQLKTIATLIKTEFP